MDWGWGVVVNFSKKSIQPTSVVGMDQEGTGSRYVVDVLLWCLAGEGEKPQPCPPTYSDKGEMKVVPVLLPQLDGISSVRIFIPKDLRPEAARATVRGSLVEVSRRFPAGVPLLDPVEDMHIQSEAFSSIIAKIVSLQDRIAKNPFHAATDKTERYQLYQRKVRVCVRGRASERK